MHAPPSSSVPYKTRVIPKQVVVLQLHDTVAKFCTRMKFSLFSVQQLGWTRHEKQSRWTWAGMKVAPVSCRHPLRISHTNFQLTMQTLQSIFMLFYQHVMDNVFHFTTYTNVLRKEHRLTTRHGLIHFIITVVVSITHFTVRNTLVWISTSEFTIFAMLWGFSYN